MKSHKERKAAWRYAIRAGLISLAWGALLSGGSWSAEYADSQSLGKQLRELAKSNRALIRARTVAKSLGGRDVWLVELGAGSAKERSARPALLVVAGIEGNDLAGSAMAMAWIERLVSQYEENDTVRKILDTTVIYVFPRLNPDAAERFFAKPVCETAVSNKPVDDDHDGMTDEDGPEDLDGDGLITWMRVRDPEGEYVLDPAEPRLLVRADHAKGQVGQWRLLTEGKDNDGDEKWNEDGPGGVNFNRNFPFQYEWFAPWSGVHQVSEVETRALADFVLAHRNIAVVFTFGEANNLVGLPQAPTGRTRTDGADTTAPRVVTTISSSDLPYYRHMGEVYRKTLGLKSELQAISQPGSFSSWMYFHQGRLSLAAQAWSPAIQLELDKSKPKAEKKEEKSEAAAEKNGPSAPSGAKKRPSRKTPTAAPAQKAEQPETRSGEDRAFLKWLDQNAPEKFVAWESFEHPDFPGRRVEIGGFAPFARTAPPESVLDQVAARQCDFLTTLSLMLPCVAIRKMTAKHLGESVYDVKIQVENTGYLPTALAHGVATREVFETRVVLDLDQEAFLSGTKTTRLPTISGSGGMREIHYVLHVPDRKQIKVTVISMCGGTVEEILRLDEAK